MIPDHIIDQVRDSADIRIVESAADPRTPWRKAGINDANALRGIHGVTLTVRDPAKTLQFMNDFMETSVVGERAGAMRVAVNGDAPGRLVEIVRADNAPNAINGLGTVHHVAFAVDDPDQQLELRRELVKRGIPVTEVMDRWQVDVLVYPHETKPVRTIADAVPNKGETPAPTNEPRSRVPGNGNRISTATGMPAMTIPAGFNTDGVPVGLEILSRLYDEPTLIRIGYAYEQANPQRKLPPTTPLLGIEKITY